MNPYFFTSLCLLHCVSEITPWGSLGCEKTREEPSTFPIAIPWTVCLTWASIFSSALQSLSPPTVQNQYEAGKSGVKRLCNVLGYFIMKGPQNQQPSHFIDSNQSKGTHFICSFIKHLWSIYYGPDAICQALRTLWWAKQPQSMIWWNCITLHRRRET